MKKINIVLIIALIAAFIVVGCDDEVKTEEENEKEYVSLDVDVFIQDDGDTLIIEGSGNLVEGTTLAVEVSNLDDGEEPFDFKDGTVEADELGNIKKEFDISDFDEGRINVYLSNYIIDQPDEVIEKYGEEGENMEGEVVVETDRGNIIEIDKIIE